MTTKTIPGVELVKVGTWSASTGVTTVTREDLDAIVTAYGDPQVDRPAIKIGHSDERFADNAGDGEPAYGWVENPRVSDDGTTLVGDLVGIPAKLAEVIPAAFRRRSVEIAWGLKTAAGAVHRAALTGLALLGVAKPAVKGMADVLALYGAADKPGAGVTAIEVVDGLDPAAVAMLAAARAEVATFAAAHQVPELTLTTALERIDRLSGMRDTVVVPPAESSPSDGGGDAGTAGNGPAPTTKEEPRMALTEQRVRELLNLEADADVEAAIAALKPADKPEGDAGTGTPPAGTAPEGTPPAGTAPAADAPAATDAPATVTLSAGALAQLQAQAKAGKDAADELAKQRRDKAIVTALREGRITPHESKTWREQLDANEASTVALLGALTPGRNGSTVEIGTDLDVSALGAGDANAEKVWADSAKDLFGVDLTGGN